MPRNCTVRRSWTGHRVGESHHRVRLSSDDVKMIRQLHQEGLGYGEIAEKFDANRYTIRNYCVDADSPKFRRAYD